MSMQPVNRSSSGVGFSLRQVVVKEIVTSRGLAICQEMSSKHTMEVALIPVRLRNPKVKETWLIDQTFGFWSFAALVKPTATPVVTGSHTYPNVATGLAESTSPVTRSLLAALVKIGLVIDGTV